MRFLVTHPLEPDVTREKVIEVLRAAQADPCIKGYRSFLSLSEFKGVCVFDAPDRDSLVKWLESNKLPYEDIWTVELEGEHGELVEVPIAAPAGTTT
ncbi:hypothetical protein LCGC14_1961210 [marine sediment metagenome]|uniref:DUF3303 domain-containing protein n=1 Tax=marine sediment metagenome TaxID=412755 RepID=A0A0F9G2Y7_9ZZZZ